ncbi:unnamed protein product [Dibothriocephalus latus]|uniref:Uncharacterized protein n=1 Tax=Dibothriocephalus latus TaxID=60516 RepID=A0A3P7NX22_DIBLA|nr:unnamed protein product [Dibothriocephalus latus]
MRPQSYINLVYPSGMSSVYEFHTRSGYPAGTIGSELMAVVVPPADKPGKSRLVPWDRLLDLNTIQNGVFKEALAKTVLQVSEFRMDFVGFYCLFRRVLRMQHDKVYKKIIEEDPRGICPRVCSRRATALDDEVNVTNKDPMTGKTTVLLRSKVGRPEKRTEQCLSIPGLPTVLSGKCSRRNGKFQND